MPEISSDSLHALVCDIAVHNCEAFDKKLFCLLFNSLFRFSLAMLPSREAAEEVAGDVLLTRWQKRMALK